MNTSHKYFVLTILAIVAALVLSACGTPATPNVQATVQAAVAATLTAPEPVVIGPDNTAPSCKGTYGSDASGFVVNFDVPAGNTMTYNYVRGTENRAVEIECPANGLGVTVRRDYEIPLIGTTPAAPTEETPFTTVITNGEWPADLFRTPVACTGKFNDESSWIICEPGVLLDNSTVWTVPSTDQIYSSNVPEGAFTYYSCGQCTIYVDGITLTQKAEKGLNYLILIRGRIDDTIVDSDLNETAKISAFVPGHMIYSHMPTGAYASRDWFKQQLVASTTSKFTNCGATGCTRTKIVLFDTDTHFYQKFLVQAGAVDNWTLLEEGTK